MDQDYPQPMLFIGGEWLNAVARETIPVTNPATGKEIARLPMASPADLDRALEEADKGFAAWRRVSAFERSKVIRRAADLLRERSAATARTMTLEQGKPLAEALAEASVCGDIFDWFAEEGRRAYGRIVPSKFPGVRNLVLKEPVGPIAAFTPWNFPATIPSRKLAAALAAGCSVVLKPAEETPGSALALVRALDDAGLPKGVVNLVSGDADLISRHLITSPLIRKISFTGSTAIGKHLARLAADGMKPSTMELGGHAPVIVFEDADIDLAVAATLAPKYRNAGQICIAPTRFFLHDAIHDRFVARFAEGARALVVGDGLASGTQMGPLANPRRMAAMEAMVGDATELGATLAAGGERIGRSGNFWRPTVITDVPDTARVMNEEPFGPLAATQRFTTFDEVVSKANQLPFGLAAYAFTHASRTANDIGDAIEAGMVGINVMNLSGPETPFGGVKESGHGSVGGSEGLEANLVTKFIAQG